MGLDQLSKTLFPPRTRLDADALRRLRPTRRPEVDQYPMDDGSILLEVPLAQSGRRTIAILARWAKSPEKRKVELEPIGALVWSLCDGERTFEGISRQLRVTYKMNRLEADAALAAFLQMLSRRGLVSLEEPGQKQ